MAERPEVAAWKQTYRQLDDATLLSLLPALDLLLSDARRQLDFLGKHDNQADAELDFRTQHLDNAMALRDQGVDVTEYLASIDAQAELSDRTKKNGDVMSR